MAERTTLTTSRLALTLVLLLTSCSAPAPEPISEQSEATATEPGDEAATAEHASEAPAPPAHPRERAPAPPASPPAAPSPQATAPPPEEPTPAPAPEPVVVEVPSGTVLGLELLTALDSSVNRVGDKVQARTLSPIYVNGELVLGSGALVSGRVTEVTSSGRVKGRAKLGFTFESLTAATGVKSIRTSFVEQEAESGKKKDAAVIGGAAGVGAIVGGIIGGKKGAAIGAGIGGAGGTGVVLGTKGEEIRLPVGTELSVRLDEPVVVELH